MLLVLRMFSQYIFCSKFNNDVDNLNMPRALRLTTDAKPNSRCVYFQPAVSTCTHLLVIIIIYNRGCAWLKQLLASILKRLRFEPTPVHVGFVVDTAAGDRFSSEHVGLPLPISLHQSSILFLSPMLYNLRN
jgi:hypothetical protein